MIQIYSPSNTDYTHNGDCVLMPSKCELTAELNGAWVLQLEHPIDEDGRWNYIEENAVLKVPTWMAEKYQRYRIRVVEKTEYVVTATAYPVFFDCRDDAYIFDIRITNKTASQALTLLLAAAPAKYTAQSNLASNESETFQNCNLLEALTGKFIDRWGGEILYNNNQVVINQRIGGDYGVTVEYGKNITGTTYNIDMTDVSTRLIPYAYNARQISGNTPWVDSPLASSYPKLFIRTVQFEDVKLADDASDDDASDDSVTVCATQADLDTELQRLCNAMYAEGADKPKISMSIDMMALENTDEYTGFENLEEIGLGDTVHCKHSKLGIVSDAKVVGIVWDCARDRIASVTLGEFAYDYLKDNSQINDIMTSLQQMAQNFNSDGSIMAEKIKGLLNGMNVQLSAQYTVAERQDVMAILFENLDTSSPLYGALGIGTQGLQISKTRTIDGRGWEWTTAATANGIVADTVVTGTISDQAAYSYWNLVTGAMKIGTALLLTSNDVLTIQAKDSNNNETFYLNSDTGVVRLNCSSFSLSGNSISQIVGTELSSYDPADNLTQLEIFNLLTGGTKSQAGPAQGIWYNNGKIYINFSYAQGGTLKLGGSNNGNGLFELYDSNDAKIAIINNNGIISYQTYTDALITDYIGFIGGRLEMYLYRTGYSTKHDCGTIGATAIYDSVWQYYMQFITPAKGFLFQKKSGNSIIDLFQILDDYIIFGKPISGGLTVNGDLIENNGMTVNGSLTANSGIDVYGIIYCTNYAYAIDFLQLSDARLKENIKPCDTDIINQLDVVQFDWKESGEHVSAGLIAQDVEKILPELVHENPKQMKSLNYTGLVPHLIKKVQEQQKEIDSLKKDIAEIKALLERR